jgi:hypothetical protein
MATPIYPAIPAARNECTNPSFETDTTGWTPVSGPLTRVSGSARDGDWHLRVLAVAANDVPGASYVVPVVAGQDVSVMAYYRIPSNRSVMMYLWFRDAANAVISNYSSPTITGNGDWKQVRWDSLAIAPAGTTNAVIYITQFVIGTVAGDIFDLDSVRIAVGQSNDVYFDGTYPDCQWTGRYAHGNRVRRNGSRRIAGICVR